MAGAVEARPPCTALHSRQRRMQAGDPTAGCSPALPAQTCPAQQPRPGQPTLTSPAQASSLTHPPAARLETRCLRGRC